MAPLLNDALPGQFSEHDDLVSVVSHALEPREESSFGGTTVMRYCDTGALARALVEWIARDPFRAVSKKRNFAGGVVKGWPERLREYAWQNRDYAETERHLKPLLAEAENLAVGLEDAGEWAPEEAERAVRTAANIFEWGGGRPRTGPSPGDVRNVFLNALRGRVLEKAPMSSSWSKVAAFATAHLEGDEDRHPQAIWDSRVSTAVVSRFDQMLATVGATKIPSELQPIAVMSSRPGSGTRPRSLTLEGWRHSSAAPLKNLYS